MYKTTMGFVKGIGTGIIAGVAVSAIGAQMMKDNKHLKRNADKAMHAVNGMIDNVETMFK